MSSFLSKKRKKEKYELDNRSDAGVGRQDKEKDYGSVTSLVNNEVSAYDIITDMNRLRIKKRTLGK